MIINFTDRNEHTLVEEYASISAKKTNVLIFTKSELFYVSINSYEFGLVHYDSPCITFESAKEYADSKIKDSLSSGL
jgi:hypothetical protein